MKDSLRKHFRALRDAVPGPRRTDASVAITKHVQELPKWKSARGVLLYSSFGSEVDTRDLLEAAWSSGKAVSLPRIEGRALMVHRVGRDTPLSPNQYGIPEPPASAEQLAPRDIDVVVVPGVAFDRRGARLGYGGGYYDRLLGTVSHALRIGLAYESQVVERLPTTLLDVPMDVLVTPSGVRVLPRREH